MARRYAVPGIVKCHGKNCRNGGVTSVFGDDTWVVGRKAFCGACRDDAEVARRKLEARESKSAAKSGART